MANIAQARYWRPNLAALRDPVVTCNGDRLRFESFSGCCGVYARLDVLDEGMDGTALDRGTTNVDVNNELRLALARVRGGDPLKLEVGPEALVVTTFDGTVVERKVPLPPRWLRGFAEVQAVTSGYDLRAELGAADAARFLRGLPNAPRGVQWLVPAGRTLRLAASPGPGAICIAGPQRLKELLPLLRFGGKLRVYGPNVARGANPAASVWQLDLPGMRLVLTLSPEITRGFSGEGAVLSALAGDDVIDDAETVAALLAFDARIEPALLADQAGLPVDRVRAALTQLGTAGRVGYDHADAAYFHREPSNEANGSSSSTTAGSMASAPGRARTRYAGRWRADAGTRRPFPASPTRLGAGPRPRPRRRWRAPGRRAGSRSRRAACCHRQVREQAALLRHVADAAPAPGGRWTPGPSTRDTTRCRWCPRPRARIRPAAAQSTSSCRCRTGRGWPSGSRPDLQVQAARTGWAPKALSRPVTCTCRMASSSRHGGPLEEPPQQVARHGRHHHHDQGERRRLAVGQVGLVGRELRGRRTASGRVEQEGGGELGHHGQEDQAERGRAGRALAVRRSTRHSTAVRRWPSDLATSSRLAARGRATPSPPPGPAGST